MATSQKSPYPRRPRTPSTNPVVTLQPNAVAPDEPPPPDVQPPLPRITGGAFKVTDIERNYQDARQPTLSTDPGVGVPDLATDPGLTYRSNEPSNSMTSVELPRLPEVLPELRKIAREGEWGLDAQKVNTYQEKRTAGRGVYDDRNDARVDTYAPTSIAVAPPPVFSREQLLRDHPEMIRRLVEMLQSRFDKLTPEEVAADSFWHRFRHMPDFGAADILNTMFSNLIAPNRGEQATPMSYAEWAALRAHPLQRYVDWLNHPTWFRNQGGRE